MTRHRTLLIGGIALVALAGVLTATLRTVYGERSAYVNVRWAPSVDAATRQQVERAHQLTQGEFREQRTWLYLLADVSAGNLRSLVQHPAVEDTHHIDRQTFRIADTAELGGYTSDRPAWIADLLEFLIRASLFGGAVAIAVGAVRTWRERRGALPSRAA